MIDGPAEFDRIIMDQATSHAKLRQLVVDLTEEAEQAYEMGWDHARDAVEEKYNPPEQEVKYRFGCPSGQHLDIGRCDCKGSE